MSRDCGKLELIPLNFAFQVIIGVMIMYHYGDLFAKYHKHLEYYI